MILLDGQELAELMIDHDVGVSLATRYDIKRIDQDYFSAGENALPVSTVTNAEDV